MVGGERVQFGVKIDIRGVDPDPGARQVLDLHIRMDLCDRDRECRAPVYDCMLAEKDDLAGCRRCCHKLSETMVSFYDK